MSFESAKPPRKGRAIAFSKRIASAPPRRGLAMTKIQKILPFLLIIVAVAAVYSSALQSGFVWDDEHLVLKNEFIKDWHKIPDIFTTNLHHFDRSGSNFYRPLVALSFMANYAMFKLKPFGYHLTNMLLHIGAASMVFAFLYIVTEAYQESLIAGLLFAVHPVNIAVVTYIAGRGDSMAAIFVLAALILFVGLLRPPSAGLAMTGKMPLYLSLLCYIFALLIKEISIIAPAAMALCIFELKRRGKTLRLPRSGKPYFYLAPFFAIAAGYIFLRLRYLNFSDMAQKMPPMATGVWWQRQITFFEVLANYLRILIAPYDLHMERIAPLRDSIFMPQVMISIAVVAAVSVILYLLRKRINFLSFSCFWFLIMLAPLSNVIFPLNARMAEHWLYMPAVGLYFLAGNIGTGIRLSLRRSVATEAISKGLLRHFVPRNDVIMYLFVALIIISYGIITFKHNFVWKDEISLYTHTLQYSPESYRVHNNLGTNYYLKNDTDKAITHYKEALRLKPSYAEAHNNLGATYFKKGMVKEAIAECSIALSIDPRYWHARTNLAKLFEWSGNIEKAVEQWQIIYNQNPKSEEAKKALDRLKRK